MYNTGDPMIPIIVFGFALALSHLFKHLKRIKDQDKTISKLDVTIGRSEVKSRIFSHEEYANTIKTPLTYTNTDEAPAESNLTVNNNPVSSKEQYLYEEPLLYGNHRVQDFSEAVVRYRKAADQGVIKAQYALGKYYDRGKGVRTEAIKMYRLAAEQGDANSQYRLGKLLSKRLRNPESIMWITLAAKQNHESALWTLSEFYYLGQYYQNAEIWYRMLANMGHCDAQYRVGKCLEYLHRSNIDYTEHLDWYRLAAQSDDAGIKNSVAWHFYNTKNYPESYFWYLVWKANGNRDSLTGCNDAERYLTKKQKADVELIAKKWITDHQ